MYIVLGYKVEQSLKINMDVPQLSYGYMILE